MDEACEADAGDVSGGTEYAFEIPDCFGSGGGELVGGEGIEGDQVRFRVDFVEEAAAIVFVEDAGETPWLFLEGLDVLDFDEEDVTWFGGLDLEGSGKVVDLS